MTLIVPPMPPSSKSACGLLCTSTLPMMSARQHQVVEAARRVELVENEPVRGREAVAVQQRAREVWRRAAQVHALAFAELAVDDDARYALQRFRDVLVRELADVLGRDRLDDGRRRRACASIDCARLARMPVTTTSSSVACWACTAPAPPYRAMATAPASARRESVLITRCGALAHGVVFPRSERF